MTLLQMVLGLVIEAFVDALVKRVSRSGVLAFVLNEIAHVCCSDPDSGSPASAAWAGSVSAPESKCLPSTVVPIAAGARFLAEFQNYRPIHAAFWLQESDFAERFLYVALDGIPDDFDIAYTEVGQVARTLQDLTFDPFQVKLIATDDPLMKMLPDRHPQRTQTRAHGKAFGGLRANEVYIYPTTSEV